METTREAILAVERGFWSADPSFFQKYMDDKAISVMEPMGFVTKEDAIKATEGAEGWTMWISKMSRS